jgi:hypothetical protein
MVASPLNPLRLCQTSVIREFGRVAKRHELLILTPFVARNRGRSVGMQRLLDDGSTADRLEEYFPFDPFTLRLSRSTIDPLYNTWSGSADDHPGSESDESDGSSDSEDDGFALAREPSMGPPPSLSSASGGNPWAGRGLRVPGQPAGGSRPIAIHGRRADDDNDFLPGSNHSGGGSSQGSRPRNSFGVSPLARSLPSAKRNRPT